MSIRLFVVLGLFSASDRFLTASPITRKGDDKREFGLRFKQVLAYAMKKLDDPTITCPPGSFFFNGSCFFYLPPKQMGFLDLTIDEASNHCRLIRAHLWDIESVGEFDYVLARIYSQTQSFDSPRIAVNFTRGTRLLNLNKRIVEQQYLDVGNTDEFTLIYKPLSDVHPANTSLVIDISKATHRVSLEEKFRLERRSNHYICKMKINSCYNNTRCGRHGQCRNLVVKYQCICNFMYTGEYCHQLSSRGIQSIIAGGLICFTLILLFLQSNWKRFCRLTKNTTRAKAIFLYSMSSKTSHRQKFYSIPNISSDQLMNNFTFTSDHSPSSNIVPDTVIDCSVKSSRSAVFFRHSFAFYFWRMAVGLLTLLFATLCCQTIYQFKVENLKSYQQIYNFTSERKPLICQFFHSKLNSYYKIPANYISLSLLLLLIIVMIFFENFSSRKKPFSFPMIFNSHSHIHRFQSAAVFGMIALEILHIFDEFIIHGGKHFQHGPLLDLIIQFGIGLMLGLRYFPVLAIFEKENHYEDRLENAITYALASVYLYSEILFKLQADISCALDQKKMSLVKESFEKLAKMGVNVKAYLINQMGVNETSTNFTYWTNSTEENYEIDNELTRLKYSLELNKQSIFYNILRNAPYYYFLVYLSVCLTVFFLRTFVQRRKLSDQSLARWKYVKYNLFQNHKTFVDEEKEYSRLFRCLNSFILFFKEYIYSIRPYFRYSKLIICIYTSGFTLIYYFTFWIQDNTYLLTKKLLLFLNLILCGLTNLSKDLCYNLNLNHLNRDIQYICLFTAAITCLQLFFGLRHYQIQMCQAYRGLFPDIPTDKHISSATIISKSIHYPGRFIGSLVYSYGFLFLFVSIFYILSRYIFYSIMVLELISKFLLPMLIFFLFQLLFVRLLCKLLFISNTHYFALRNLRLYYAFSYFSFFFDCFLGFITCLTRISKAFLCALIFFARLDYSPYGRGLELFDSSYASYVGFFHVERNQRHPVLNVFIDIVRRRLLDRRKLKLKSTREESLIIDEREKCSQLRRFRWALAYTLIHNEQLKRYRKHRLSSTRTIQSKTLERLFDRIGFSQTLPKKF